MSYGNDSIDETCAALLPDCAAGWERQGSSGSREEGERGSGDRRACTVLAATRSVPLSVALPSHLCGETLRFAPQTVPPNIATTFTENHWTRQESLPEVVEMNEVMNRTLLGQKTHTPWLLVLDVANNVCSELRKTVTECFALVAWANVPPGKQSWSCRSTGPCSSAGRSCGTAWPCRSCSS